MSRSRACAVLASLVVLLILHSVVASAQTVGDPRRDTFWLGGGLGAGSEDFAGSLNGSYQFGGNVVSLRVSGTAGIFDDGFGDYAVLYGRALLPSDRRNHASVGIGVGLVNGCSGGGLAGCQGVPKVIGLPIEVQAIWHPGSLVGVGLYGFANINDARSFAGLTFGLQVGRLR
jgi:hypothetical protein